MSSRLLARILRSGGVRVLNSAINRVLPDTVTPAAPRKKASLGGALLGAAAVRIATRSVPGAILIGGGLLAKARYDKRRAKKGDSAGKAPSDT